MVRIVVADQDQLRCSVTAAAVASQADIEVVASVTTVDAALDHAATCDVILASANLADRGAYRIAQEITDRQMGVEVVIMDVGEREAEILGYIEAGAAAFVPRGAGADELVEQIRHAVAGTADLPPKLVRSLMHRTASLVRKCERLGIDVDLVAHLTPRQHEVLECIAAGMTNAEIADQLFIDVGTVKNHVHQVLDKLGASSRKEAVTNYLGLLMAGLEKRIDEPEPVPEPDE